MPLKLLWHSETPTLPTGFGNVTRFICKGLTAKGIEVHVVSWGVNRETIVWDSLTLHHHSALGLGTNAIYQYVLKISPDFVVTFGDPTWLGEIVKTGLDGDIRRHGGRWVVYYTVDGETPEGKLPEEWAKMINVADVRITCSSYGVGVSRKSGVEARYIPHGVDVNLFSPPPDKDGAKRKLGYEGKFVVLSDSRNQPRKMLPRLITAFALFAKNKDDVLLHLHTDPEDRWSRFDILSLIRVAGISDKVRFTEGFTATSGIAPERLAEIYQASDVHFLASGGEGFGLPTLQACSTGLVPCGVDYTANSELIRGHGELLGMDGYEAGRFGLRVAVVNIRDCVDKLEKYYNDAELLRKTGSAAREFALGFSWETVIGRWYDTLHESAGHGPEPENPWVTRGKVSLSYNGVAGHDALVSRVRQQMRPPPGVEVSLNMVAMNILPGTSREVYLGVSEPGPKHKPAMVACLSVWNNAATIQRTLRSVEHKAGRIVIVDGRVGTSPPGEVLSDDGTLETIGKEGLEKIELILPKGAWKSEAEKRNAYLRALFEGDWLLSLEPQEHLVGDLPDISKLSRPRYSLGVTNLDNREKREVWEQRLTMVRRGYHFHTDKTTLEDRTHRPLAYDGVPRLTACRLVRDGNGTERRQGNRWHAFRRSLGLDGNQL